MSGVVLHQHLSLLKEWCSGISINNSCCLRAVIELGKIPEVHKDSPVDQGCCLRTAGQEGELCQCHFRKTKDWIQSFFSETDPNHVPVVTTCFCLICLKQTNKQTPQTYNITFFFQVLHHVMEYFIVRLTCRINESHKLILETWHAT